jgi:Sec-independent protein translocase protein TatA
MFGFGGLSEVFFILFLAMLIFGPEKLPEIGRMLAKGMAEVRKASNELKRTLNAELAASEQEQAARRNLQAVPAPAAEQVQASEPAPPMWPAASAIPEIQAFPAATPAEAGAPATEASAAAALATQASAPGTEIGDPATEVGGSATEASAPLTEASAPATETAPSAGATVAADTDGGAPAPGTESPPAVASAGAGDPASASGPAAGWVPAAAAASPLLAPYGEGHDPNGEAAHAAQPAAAADVVAEPR